MGGVAVVEVAGRGSAVQEDQARAVVAEGGQSSQD